jgi:hypothetical protein
MPGRHGGMRYKRNKSKRQRPDQMETTLKDSIHNSRRKEQAILKPLIPPKLQPVKKRVVPSRQAASSHVRIVESNAMALAQARVDVAPGAADVDPAMVLQKLAALRQSVINHDGHGALTSSTVDWAARRQQPAPELQGNEARRHQVLARRQERREIGMAQQAAAKAKKAERRARALALSAAEDGEDAAEEDGDAAEVEGEALALRKGTSVGKKAEAKMAFKVLKAKVERKKQERAAKKDAKNKPAKKSAQSKPSSKASDEKKPPLKKKSAGKPPAKPSTNQKPSAKKTMNKFTAKPSATKRKAPKRN